MSYRELRQLAETMRALGYPRLISLESFRTPNFELVADILYWLVQRHDPSAELSDDIKTEAARIAFIKAIAELLHVKLRLRLSCRRLYQADLPAAQELLKLARVLQLAMAVTEAEPEERDLTPDAQLLSFDSKAARERAAELTTEGARLGELLRAEMGNLVPRSRVISEPQDLGKVEGATDALVRDLRQDTAHLQEALTASQADEQGLRAKIEHKRTQADRTTKRLRDLQNTKPEHQDEYEWLETELSQHYGVYLQNFRNLEYLEAEFEKLNDREEKQMAEQANKLRVLREKLRREETAHIREADQIEETALACLASSRSLETSPLSHRSAGNLENFITPRSGFDYRGKFDEMRQPAAQNQGAPGPRDPPGVRPQAGSVQARPASGRRQRQHGALQNAEAKPATPPHPVRTTTLGEPVGGFGMDSDHSGSNDDLPPAPPNGLQGESGSEDGDDSDTEDTDEEDDSDDDDDEDDDEEGGAVAPKPTRQ